MNADNTRDRAPFIANNEVTNQPVVQLEVI